VTAGKAGVLGSCLGGTLAFGVAIDGDPDVAVCFDNHESPMFHQPEPAARAWEITREFLARTLPV